MLAFDDATNFIEHLDCTLIVADKQSLQGFLEIINPSRPTAILQCSMSSNLAYEIVDNVTHGYCSVPKDLPLRRYVT